MSKKEKKEVLEGEELKSYFEKIKRFTLIMIIVAGIIMVSSWFCPWRF